MTFDDYGGLVTDAGVEHAPGTGWWETQSFALPVDTRVVTIEGDNPWLGGGILASFRNGVVTDGTWQCADMSSCNTTECENSVTWQDVHLTGCRYRMPVFQLTLYLETIKFIHSIKNNLFRVEGDRLEQRSPPYIVQCCQQYCSALLNLNQPAMRCNNA